MWIVGNRLRALLGLDVDIVDKNILPMQLKVINILNSCLNNQLVAIKKLLSTCPQCPHFANMPTCQYAICGQCGQPYSNNPHYPHNIKDNKKDNALIISSY